MIKMNIDVTAEEPFKYLNMAMKREIYQYRKKA